MSKSLFIELGLSQPAWVILSSDNSFSHLALAFLCDSTIDEKKVIMEESESSLDTFLILTPMLKHSFRNDSQILVQSFKFHTSGSFVQSKDLQHVLKRDLIGW